MRGVRTVVWEGSDPNGDDLRYRVEVREARSDRRLLGFEASIDAGEITTVTVAPIGSEWSITG